MNTNMNNQINDANYYAAINQKLSNKPDMIESNITNRLINHYDEKINNYLLFSFTFL